jgi:hypothetical protein
MRASIRSLAALGLVLVLATVPGCSSSPDQSDAGPDGGSMQQDSGMIMPGDPVITSFTANPSTLATSGTTLLSWNVSDATSLSIDQGIGDVMGTTSKSVNVPATTAFTLTATNSHGTVTKQAVVTVTTPAPTIASFTAVPSMLVGSGTALLAWSVTGATALSIDNGVGDVTTKTSKSVTVKATTTFTLTATGAGGTSTAPATVTVATAVYVDATSGDDANAGTAASPFKTLTKAASVAQSGDTVYLYDSVYDSANEGGATTVNVPDGVMIQAVHARAASISGLALVVPTGSGTFVDLKVDGASSAISGQSTASGSTLTLTGLQFANGSRLLLQGAVKATMNAGSFAGSHTPAGPGFAGIQGSAELVVHGGLFDGAGKGQGSFGGGLFTVANNGKLTLDGVTIRVWSAAAVYIGGTATINPPTLTLQGGTVLDNVGAVGNCAAEAAVILSGTPTLTLDNAQIINSKNAAICIRTGSNLTVAVRNGSRLTGNLSGLVSEPGSGASQLALTVDASAVNSNTTSGIEWTWDGTLNLTTSTFDGNGTGVLLLPGGTALSLKARSSTFKNNTSAGFYLLTNAAVDLGTAADQGQNSFVGDAITGFDLASPTGLSVPAIGNSWNPNVQGADANGRYPANTSVTGAATGQNYSISGSSTLSL